MQKSLGCGGEEGGMETHTPMPKTKGENSLYFEFVAETQNIIREERHDVLGLCFIQLKAKQSTYSTPDTNTFRILYLVST